MSSSRSGIEWTDATWNPVTGCSKVSPGCAHCYAERLAPKVFAGQMIHERVELKDAAGYPVRETVARKRRFTDVVCHEDRLDTPLHWRKPRRIFVNSMSDLFHEAVPDAFIDRVFAVMALAPQHTFQILTKRAERAREYLTAPDRKAAVQTAIDNMESWDRPPFGDNHAPLMSDWPLPNVWLGVSVENQHFADERIPLLLQTPAAVRFISAEPLLERVGLFLWLHQGHMPMTCLDWVIVGGESGPGARPFNVAWARSIVRQCKSAGVPVFVKQLGADVRDRNDAGFDGCSTRAWPEAIEERDAVEHELSGYREEWQGAEVRIHLRDRKGGDPSEWPEDLRVREFPGVEVYR